MEGTRSDYGLHVVSGRRGCFGFSSSAKLPWVWFDTPPLGEGRLGEGGRCMVRWKKDPQQLYVVASASREYPSQTHKLQAENNREDIQSTYG